MKAPKPIYILDEDLAYCLMNAAYKFVELFDEAFFKCRVEPTAVDEIASESLANGEAQTALGRRIGTDLDVF